MVTLVDAQGNVAASYSYDAFGQLTAFSENFGGGTTIWTNPYRYDGRDGVRYDGETEMFCDPEQILGDGLRLAAQVGSAPQLRSA
jgi:hypothetical protein